MFSEKVIQYFSFRLSPYFILRKWGHRGQLAGELKRALGGYWVTDSHSEARRTGGVRRIRPVAPGTISWHAVLTQKDPSRQPPGDPPALSVCLRNGFMGVEGIWHFTANEVATWKQAKVKCTWYICIKIIFFCDLETQDHKEFERRVG